MTESSRLKYYTLAGFFVIGVVTVLLGQVLPILSRRLDLNDAEAGTLFIAQFSGSLLGTLFSSRIARSSGFVMTTLIGLVMMVVGLPGLNFSHFVLCWSSVFVYGIGLGLTIPAVNLLTIESTPPDKQSSAINLINFAWGVGAICSQPFAQLVSRGESLVAVSLILDIILVVLVICFVSLHRIYSASRVEHEPSDSSPQIWRRPSSWLFILFGFFVIGIETGLGGWLTSYSEALKRMGHDGINTAVVFFTFMVIGRGLASVISRRLSENVLISICAIVLLTGIVLIVSSESAAIVGAAIAGLGTSAIFPTNMVRFTRIFGPDAISQATPLFISGIIGAASLSWL
ncbi:MAG TPA: MFS transporter, partial [Pyrinomonadaceae bacterium]|nr:MFS transporter [Pyrinomonadaceae bacterium]